MLTVGEKVYCLYAVNIFGPTEDWFLHAQNEEAFEKLVLRDRFASHLKRSGAQLATDRVSEDGVLVFALFSAGEPANFGSLKETQIKISYSDEEMVETLPASQRVHSLSVARLDPQPTLGTKIRVQVQPLNSKPDERFAWFRPRNGLALDYQAIGVAVSCRSDFGECGRLSFIPATVRLQYRTYLSDGSGYYFLGVGVGPVVGEKLPVEEGGDGDRSAANIQGVAGVLSFDISGFEVGVGGMLAFDVDDDAAFRPLLTVSVTDLTLRRLGLGKYPPSLLGPE